MRAQLLVQLRARRARLLARRLRLPAAGPATKARGGGGRSRGGHGLWAGADRSRRSFSLRCGDLGSSRHRNELAAAPGDHGGRMAETLGQAARAGHGADRARRHTLDTLSRSSAGALLPCAEQASSCRLRLHHAVRPVGRLSLWRRHHLRSSAHWRAPSTFRRARPKLLFANGEYSFTWLAGQADYWSFPSGHTANAVAIALAVSMIWPRCRVLAAI